jgi:two-component system, OmpR family, phosphate regulon response regulator PhoB
MTAFTKILRGTPNVSSPKLLLVEDDMALAELLEYRFESEGYDVRVTADGDEALVYAAEEAPDLVILDWMIEGTSGIEVCRRLRRDKGTAHVPIFMLTAREAEDDRVRGLETGADDYVTKPFSPRELLARVSAVLRRVRPALAGETIEAGDMKLDPVAHRVERRGRQLQVGPTEYLGPTEYRLLKFFMEHPRRVFSRNQLLDAVWGTGSEIEERTVDVHIRRLRKAIALDNGRDPIRTVRSAGYALEPV